MANGTGTPDWVASYKTPPEFQAVASGRATGAVPSSASVPFSAGGTGLDVRNELVRRMSAAPVASFADDKTPKPDKYATIETLQRSQKVEALKDVRLDPHKIQNPYDTLSHNFHLWTVVGNKALSNVHISQEKQQEIASTYYDKMIAPVYAGLHLAPMDKKLWMQQAYKEALQYNIEDAYTNNLTHDLKTGTNAGLASVARAYGRMTDMLGNTVDDAVALWRSGKFAQTVEDFAASRPNWFKTMQEINTQVQAKRAAEEPSLVKKGAIIQSAKRQFWADALPTQDGFWNKATSMVAEGAGQLPIFAAMEAGATPFAPEASLTGILGKSGIGKKVSGYLLAGGEGLAFGAAAHKQDDPGEAWRDAIGFAVFHGLFDVGGMGLKKLMDVVPESMKAKMDAINQRLNMAQNGQRPATSVEKYEMHKEEVANNLVATGVAGQRAIFVNALHHIESMEKSGLDRAGVQAKEAELLEKDPDSWSPVLSSAKFVRSLLGEKKLSEIQPGSDEEKYLSERLAQLIVDSADKIGTAAKGMDEVHAEKAVENLSKPSAKHTLEFYEQQATEALSKAGGVLSKEKVQQYAAKMYAEDLAKATEEAEKEVAEKPVEKATNAAKRRKDKTILGIKIRSERAINKYGEPSARYQVVPDYKVRLKQHIAAARKAGKSMAQYFQDLDDQDFVDDLTKYFYPKELRKAKIFFEHQNTREGMQNPNFLAFMYNYLPQMPKEFGQQLENKMIDTVKVQKYMRGKEPSEPQLLYYAKAMYNHVDNFLGSGRWPEEHNLFRTSNESMFKTTEWQRQLLLEKQLQEQANLKDMFSGDKKALKTALTVHAAFSKLRLHEFDSASMKRGSQDIIRGYDELIADLQTENKAAKAAGYKRWRF